MKRQLRFHDEALEEIRRAARWYDDKREGLGGEFLDALHARLGDLINATARGGRLAGAASEVPVRRVLLERFPYVVVFLETAEELRVIAVMHAKRRPGYWMKRTKR